MNNGERHAAPHYSCLTNNSTRFYILHKQNNQGLNISLQ